MGWWLLLALGAEPVELVVPGSLPEAGTVYGLPCQDEGACGYERVSDVMLYGSTGAAMGVGALHMAPSLANTDTVAWDAGAGTLAAVGSCYLLNMVAKGSFSRARPYSYSPDFDAYDEHAKKDAYKSFYSGHTSVAAASLFSMATVHAAYSPDGEYKAVTVPVAFGAAAAGTWLTGRMRVRAGRHFRSDVFTGAIVGTLLGVGVPLGMRWVGDQTRPEPRQP